MDGITCRVKHTTLKTSWIAVIALLFVLCIQALKGDGNVECAKQMKTNFFQFCSWNSAYERTPGSVLINTPCQETSNINPDLILIQNISVLKPRPPPPFDVSRCNNPNKNEFECALLKPSEKTQVVKPLFIAISGRRADDKKLTKDIDTSQTPFKNTIVKLNYDCVQVKDIINPCENVTKTFTNKKNSIYLKFDEESYYESGNHSSCLCNLDFNSTIELTVQTVDVRMKAGNSLSLNGKSLTNQRFYWLQDGSVDKDVKEIYVSGLRPGHLPTSLWLQIDATNFNITCGAVLPGTKIPDTFGGNGRRSGTSKSGGLSVTIIVVICISAVVLLVLSMALVRCAQRRCGNDEKDEDEDEEEGNVKMGFIRHSDLDRDMEKGRSAATDSDEEVIYAEPDNPNGKVPAKERRRNDYTAGQKVNNNTDKRKKKSEDEPESSQPKNTSIVEVHHTDIYNHLGDKPDIVPPTDGHIYDTSGVNDYSSLNRLTNSKPSGDRSDYDF